MAEMIAVKWRDSQHAQYQDAAKTALEAGHSQDVLFAHYRELVTADDAAIWWSGWTMIDGKSPDTPSTG